MAAIKRPNAGVTTMTIMMIGLFLVLGGGFIWFLTSGEGQ